MNGVTSEKGAYTRDCQGHVEILAPLETEAPRGWADQRHTVGAHGSKVRRAVPKKCKKLQKKIRWLIKMFIGN